MPASRWRHGKAETHGFFSISYAKACRVQSCRQVTSCACQRPSEKTAVSCGRSSALQDGRVQETSRCSGHAALEAWACAAPGPPSLPEAECAQHSNAVVGCSNSAYQIAQLSDRVIRVLGRNPRPQFWILGWTESPRETLHLLCNALPVQVLSP